jgi:hypothetical protein
MPPEAILSGVEPLAAASDASSAAFFSLAESADAALTRFSALSEESLRSFSRGFSGSMATMPSLMVEVAP